MTTEKQSNVVKGDITFASSCALHNSYLVTEKLILFICEVLEHSSMSKAEIYGIIFEENKPLDREGKPMFASFYPAVKSFVVNLGKHLDDALSYTMREDNTLRVDAVLWYSTLITILHELKHAIDLQSVGDDMEAFDKLPEDAQGWAYIALTAIAASGIDIEPPDLMSDPYYGEAMTQIFEDITVGEEPWHKFQYTLFDRSVISDNGTETCCTLREYVRSCDSETTRVWSEVKDIETMLAEVAEEHASSSDDDAMSDLAEVATLAETIRVEPTAEAEPAIELGDIIPEQRALLPEPKTIVTEVETVVETAEGVVEVAPSLVAEATAPAPVDDIPRQPDFAMGEDTSAPETVIAPGAVTPAVAGALPVNHNAGLTVAAPTLSPVECGLVMTQVYARLYRNMFEKCGFQANADQGWTSPAAILDPVYLGDIPGVEQLLISYDSYDVMGVPALHVPLVGEGCVAEHHVKGSLNKDKSQPCYIIYVNIGGKLHRRALRPQDCNKRDGNGVLKAWAKDARAGVQIMSIYRDLSPVEKQDGVSVFAAKIIGVPGQHPVLTTNPFDEVHKKEVVI